jgi:hypothetical protein
MRDCGEATPCVCGVTDLTNRIAISQAVHAVSHAVHRLGLSDVDDALLEWWLHVRSSRDPMHAHFDRDEGAFSASHVMRTPRLSTVLYLSDEGGPTFVVDQALRITVNADGSESAATEPERAERAWLIAPKRNRLLIFDGALLHGVRPAPARAVCSDKGEITIERSSAPRITLMTNFWQHALVDESARPMAALTIDAATLRRFGLPLSDLHRELSAERHRFITRDSAKFLYRGTLDDLYFFDFAFYLNGESSDTAPDERTTADKQSDFTRSE